MEQRELIKVDRSTLMKHIVGLESNDSSVRAFIDACISRSVDVSVVEDRLLPDRRTTYKKPEKIALALKHLNDKLGIEGMNNDSIAVLYFQNADMYDYAAEIAEEHAEDDIPFSLKYNFLEAARVSYEAMGSWYRARRVSERLHDIAFCNRDNFIAESYADKIDIYNNLIVFFDNLRNDYVEKNKDNR